MGLQTANYKTLNILNRCEDLADFIKACNMINEYGFRICTHVILSLPWDDDEDIIETARIINVLRVKEVKIHSLFVAIQRLVGRAPKEDSVFCNWNCSWWMIRHEIIDYMNENNIFQGDMTCQKEYKKLKGEMK